jgi:prefoldin subunit 5
MGELQKLIKEAQNYRDEIEDMHVKLQHLSIQIQCLEDTTNTLSE